MATTSKFYCVVAASGLAVIGLALIAQAEPGAAPDNVAVSASKPDGKELFQREWLPNDPRSHGGDGLGPVFNDSSCVACHNQGGSGGGGPASKNVDIITAFSNPVRQQQAAQMEQPAVQTLPGMILNVFVDSLSQGENRQPATPGTVTVSSGTLTLTTRNQAPQNSNTLPAATANPPSGNIQVTVVGDGQPAPSDAAQPAAVNATPPVAASPATPAAPSTPAIAPATEQTAAVPTPAAQPTGAAAPAAQPAAQPGPEEKLAEIKRQKAELAKIHPGFLSARSVVLHRFSTDEKYDAWRVQMLGLGQFGINANVMAIDDSSFTDPQDTAALAPANQATTPAPVVQIKVVSSVDAEQKMQQLKMQAQMTQAQGLQGQVGDFSFIRSRRNPTALFGVGLIDQIPDQVLIDQAKKEFKGFPEIQGRVAKMKDGKIGRFGWKDQKASLYEFAMTACAVELGLDVPDHPQAGLPSDPKYKPQGHDMDEAECVALVSYLGNLPAPVRHQPASAAEAKILSVGEKQFAAVGCANCHAEKLGNVVGIYSDLLLHDMGSELGDSGNYGVFVPDTPEEEQQEEPIPSLQAQFNMPNGGPQHLTKADREKTFGALRQEWRTPPLWGVRDSGPYLHDGRAETLEQAIAFHGGEASNSAKQFFMLKPEERAQLVEFLKSLTAPSQEQGVVAAN
ncbi:MAG TPA: di-heme oxidoredictase family protein [Pirellulales bacterium]|jgi:CxxC motif-containing protein (DUF1111 family)|nr:di-heme oxidoredictase family protein [Pirellulales bacterium]